jgi:hypothetical protein
MEEKDFLSKWMPKSVRGNYAHICKVDFTPKLIRKEKKHFILIRGTL